MKAMHDVLGEVEIINASEGLTVLIEHDGQTKEVPRRSVVPLPAAENASLRSLLADHVGLLRGQAEIARNQGYYVAASALEKAADEAAKEAVK